LATSGVNTNIDTARDIITDALVEIGVVGAGRSADANDLEIGRRRLNWMLKDWQSRGLNLWRNDEITIPWPAYTVEGDLDQNYTDIFALSVARSSTHNQQLTRWEMDDYARLPNQLQTSDYPNVYCLFRGLDALRVRLWPVPNQDVTLYASGARVIEDVTDLSQNIDVPQQYTRTAMLNLAASLVPVFGKASDPNAAVTVALAQQAFTQMMGDDRPASYFLGADRDDYARAW
jgi:hypothetical protein